MNPAEFRKRAESINSKYTVEMNKINKQERAARKVTREEGKPYTNGHYEERRRRLNNQYAEDITRLMAQALHEAGYGEGVEILAGDKFQGAA